MKSFAIALCCLCLGCGAISGQEPSRNKYLSWVFTAYPLIVFPDGYHSPSTPGYTFQLAAQIKTAWTSMRQPSDSDHLAQVRTAWPSVRQPSDSDHLAWSSSDEHIATVDSKGLLTAIGPGTARITVECKNCRDPAGLAGTTCFFFFAVRSTD